MEFRDTREEAARTAWTTLESVRARPNAPDKHQPVTLVLLTANGRYSNRQVSIFGRSKVSVAGIVRIAKYFRISEWTTISRSGTVLEAALQWINQADLHKDDYWHHYYKVLHRNDSTLAKEFLLGTLLLVLLHASFNSQFRISDAGMARRCRPLETAHRGARPGGPSQGCHLYQQRAADSAPHSPSTRPAYRQSRKRLQAEPIVRSSITKSFAF